MRHNAQITGSHTRLLALLIIIGSLASVLSLTSPAVVHADGSGQNDTILLPPDGGCSAPDPGNDPVTVTSSQEAESSGWGVAKTDLDLFSQFSTLLPLLP